MMQRTPRVLLGLSSLLLIVGAGLHASAFPKVVAAVAASNLPAHFGQAFKGLWLVDAATLFIVGVALAWIAARPESGSRLTVVSLALIPGATAVLLYLFMGNFPPSHLLVVITVMGVFAGMRWGRG